MSTATPQERIQAATDEIVDAQKDMEKAELAASEKRAATKGWPIMLADGTEISAVDTIPNTMGIGPTVVDADGTEYVAIAGNPANGYQTAADADKAAKAEMKQSAAAAKAEA